jgi:hypothetical protein
MSSSRLIIAARQWQERGLIWGNSHQRENITQYILSKKRKNTKQKHTSMHNTPFRVRLLQQSTLEGHNLDLNDTEQFGNTSSTKQANTLRIGFQNMNFLAPVSAKDSQNSQCFDYINQNNFDAYGMSKVGLHWISLFPEDQWDERVSSQFRAERSVSRYNQ